MSIKGSMPPQQALLQLRDHIQRGESLPALLLAAGEEPYYIDRLEELVTGSYIPEKERPTQMKIFFGPETAATEVLQSAQTVSMFAAKRLIVVREANQLLAKPVQGIKYTAASLLADAGTFAPGTTLLLLYRDKLSAQLRKEALGGGERILLFESNPLKRDSELKPVMEQMAQDIGMTLSPGAVRALTDLVGRDLVTLYTELQKLSLPARDAGGTVSQDMVLQLVGMSREYNPYDLLRAIQENRPDAATQIALRMADNDKRYPLPMILAMLYNFFANLIVVHYMGGKGSRDIVDLLGLKSEYQARSYRTAQHHFSPRHTLGIISAIRQADAAFKGANGSSLSPRAIYQDLLAQIFSFRY